LDRGELGCPSGPQFTRCDYKTTYLAGAVTGLGGSVQASGDISTILPFVTSTVDVTAAYLRNTNLKINNNLIGTLSTDIGNTVTFLSLKEDGGLKPTDLKLGGKVQVGAGSKGVEFKGEANAEGDFIWEADKEVASVFATYLEQGFTNFFNAGPDEDFLL